MIMLIVIVFDLSEHLEDFIQKKAPAKAIVFDYFLNLVPQMMSTFSPLFTFISVIFFTSRLASNSEIVSILSSGISFNRMLRPYWIASGVIAISSLLLNNFVIPFANEKRVAFADKYIHNPYFNDLMHIHMQLEPGTFVYVERYYNKTNTGDKFSLEKIKDRKLSYKLTSSFARYDSTTEKWQIHNYIIRKFKDGKEMISRGEQMDTALTLHPRDFGRKSDNVETMAYFELNKYIQDEKSKGNPNTEFFEIEKYSRSSYPFATFILTLIGVSLSSRKVRGGIGLHIGMGLLISFTFILFMRVSTTFALSGGVIPIIAVWIPNVLYLGIAYYLYRIAPK